jgi:hypothetical protein
MKNDIGNGVFYSDYIPLICITFALLCSLTFCLMTLATQRVDLVNAEIALLLISVSTTSAMVSLIYREQLKKGVLARNKAVS